MNQLVTPQSESMNSHESNGKYIYKTNEHYFQSKKFEGTEM